MAIKSPNRSGLKRRLPGYIATGLVILTTSFWTLWSMGEVYYEAWGISYTGPVAYLMPAVVCLAFTLVVLTWPRFGGWLPIVLTRVDDGDRGARLIEGYGVTIVWAPDLSSIYYWSSDEYDERRARYVNYSGSTVSHQPKLWGNPRHGYRCVREP